MFKNLYNLLGLTAVAIQIVGCGKPVSTENNYPNGNNLVRIISDSALIIDQDADSGNAKFFIENNSDQAIDGIEVYAESSSINIASSDCGTEIEPHSTCEVSYTGKLEPSKFQDSATVSALFSIGNVRYKSDGVIDLLRNPDSGAASFTIVNQRAMRNLDAEFNIHANGKLNHYQINHLTVNGHEIKLANDAQIKMNGGDTISVLVPAEIVNETDPFTSEMKLSIDGGVNSKPLLVSQSFMVGAAPSGSTYQPVSGYINPTYSANISQSGGEKQNFNLMYIESIPAGAVTDNKTHNFKATLLPSPNMPTATAAVCANVLSFMAGANNCDVTITGSGGTSPASSKNCAESFTLDPASWPSNLTYAQCQYIPAIQDNIDGVISYPANGVLTINIAKNQNSVSAAIFSDSSQAVATVNSTGTGLNYANNSSLPFVVNGSNTSYRWVKIVNYEPSESVTVSYSTTSYTTNNSTVVESPTMVTSLFGAGNQACNGNFKLAPSGQPNSSCYTVWAVTPSVTSGLAKDILTFTPTFTTSLSGRVSSYTSSLLMQYANFSSYLGNMTTVMGGPNGVPFKQAVTETAFITQALNGSYGGNTPSACGTSSNGNTYQCIMQGSYMNIKLPQNTASVAGGLPGSFTYILANESALEAKGYVITYALADTANPQLNPTTWTSGGCTIPAYSALTKTCYINIQNPWNANNTANGNEALNVVGYFTSNPNLYLSNNWINFYGLKPGTKLLPTYQASKQPGDDGYWSAGESFGLAFAIGTSSDNVNRFFYDSACTGSVKCLVDKITGLEFIVQFDSTNGYDTYFGRATEFSNGSTNITIDKFGAYKLLNGNNKFSGYQQSGTSGMGLNQSSFSQYGRYQDWRLPNSNELFSLFSYTNGPESTAFPLPVANMFSISSNNVIYDYTISQTGWYGGSYDGANPKGGFFPNMKLFLQNDVKLKNESMLYQTLNFASITGGMFIKNTAIISFPYQYGPTINFEKTNSWIDHFVYGSDGKKYVASQWFPVRNYVSSGFVPKAPVLTTNQQSLFNVATNIITNKYAANMFGQELGGSDTTVSDGKSWEDSAVIAGRAVAWGSGGGNYPVGEQSSANGRFVSDPTGECYIDLLTGLFYDKSGIFSQSKNSATNTFAKDFANYINLDKNSGISNIVLYNNNGNAGISVPNNLCGLANWRVANNNEIMSMWNYYYATSNMPTSCSNTSCMAASWGNTKWLNNIFGTSYVDFTQGGDANTNYFFYSSTYAGGNNGGTPSEPGMYLPYFAGQSNYFTLGEYRMSLATQNGQSSNYSEAMFKSPSGANGTSTGEVATLVAGGASRIQP